MSTEKQVQDIAARRESVPPFEATTNPDGSITARSNLRFTPAPLDPTTIRKGSKIRLEDGPEADANYVGGTVGHVDPNGFVIIDHLGTFAVVGLTDATRAKGYRAYRLTHHQLGPEPEWRQGQFASAMVRGLKRRTGVWVKAPEGASYGLAFIDEAGVSSRPDYLTDVRPLVVIDPADVDVEALIRVARKVGDKSIMAFADSTAENIVRAVLAASGIEVPR